MANAITGFGTRISIGGTITFLENDVTPVGYVGDEKIEQTSNANTRFHSYEVGDLIEKTDISANVHYLIEDLAAIKAAINVKQSVVVTFKDGSTITDNGWLKEFNPASLTAGEKPKADIVISFEGEDADGVDNEAIVSTV